MANISEMTISKETMKAKVKNIVDQLGGAEAAAINWSCDEWTISASYLRQVITGAVKPGKRLCLQVGYEPVKEIKYRYRKLLDD